MPKATVDKYGDSQSLDRYVGNPSRCVYDWNVNTIAKTACK